jgi:hypothetical protein
MGVQPQMFVARTSAAGARSARHGPRSACSMCSVVFRGCSGLFLGCFSKGLCYTPGLVRIICSVGNHFLHQAKCAADESIRVNGFLVGFQLHYSWLVLSGSLAHNPVCVKSSHNGWLPYCGLLGLCCDRLCPPADCVSKCVECCAHAVGPSQQHSLESVGSKGSVSMHAHRQPFWHVLRMRSRQTCYEKYR